MVMCGGISDSAGPPDEQAREVFAVVKADIIKKAIAGSHPNADQDNFEVIAVKTQIVAGINYFAKIRLGTGFLHAQVYAPLPHTKEPPELVELKTSLSEDHPLEYF